MLLDGEFIWQPQPSKPVGGANGSSTALVCFETESRWRISVDLLELVRDILDRAEDVEAGAAVAFKAEFIQVAGVICLKGNLIDLSHTFNCRC